MIKPLPVFDIMIVYDAALAFSAADNSYHGLAPFAIDGEHANCNIAYQYFIQYCKEQNLTAAFTTTNDVNAAGQFNSIWTYTDNWERHQDIANGKVIFDKFSNLFPRNRKAANFLSAILKPLKLFHNQAMRVLFDNKLETYLKFPNYTIPTVKIDVLTEENISQAKRALSVQCEHHPYRDDFQTNLVLKDQFGMGGTNIFKITNDNDFLHIPYNPLTHFILQPFIKASGFNIAHCAGDTDLRVIICNNIIIQSYMRIAKAGEFRANAQQGGRVVYLNLSQIPPEVLLMVGEIKQHLPSKTALYALDFIKSDHGHLYFIEGNNSPGINWFDHEDETRAKQLIRIVVQNLKRLILAS